MFFHRFLGINQEMNSTSSYATTNVTGEASYLNSGNDPSSSNTRNLQQDSNTPTTRLKGVVGQLNGHWGSQIYANHERIWIGTFKSEKEAAMAYDSAAIKLRNGDSYRNFPWTSINAQEPSFQSQFSTEVVLSMIKDGSYSSKFEAYLNARRQIGEIGDAHNLLSEEGKGGILCRQLFQKELTPSDVGKLNRLVIPKKFALKNFPRIAEIEGDGGEVGDVQLTFYDISMRLWKFRYCYWKSSQSYVFTRGWNKFVNEKDLKAKDTVSFSLCECKNVSGGKGVSAFFMIDVSRHEDHPGTSSNAAATVESSGRNIGFGVELHDLEEKDEDGDIEEEFTETARVIDFLGTNLGEEENEKVANEGEELAGIESVEAERKGFKLFGVQIS